MYSVHMGFNQFSLVVKAEILTTSCDVSGCSAVTCSGNPLSVKPSLPQNGQQKDCGWSTVSASPP